MEKNTAFFTIFEGIVQAQPRDAQSLFLTERAFVAVLANRSVVTLGMNDQGGGDSSSVQHQLDGKVRHIAATRSAFAAFLVDRSVVTWGCFEEGGDASEVQNQLYKIYQDFLLVDVHNIPQPLLNKRKFRGTNVYVPHGLSWEGILPTWSEVSAVRAPTFKRSPVVELR
eukprot:s1438_g7.t1